MSTDAANNFVLPCVSLNLSNICYRPQQSCEGYVFTGVCPSTGEEYLTRHTPQTRYPLGPGTSPRARYTPWTRHTPSRDQVHLPPGTPRTRYTPQTRYTPPDQVHPPPEIRPLLRTVRILLECILVLMSKPNQHISSENNGTQ